MNTYERRFYAGSFRHLKTQAEKVLTFFAACLTERQYPQAQEVGQELLSLINSVDVLLTYEAFREGFLRLETEELQITAWALYAEEEAEDLGVPSLLMLGDPPTDASFTLTLSGKPVPSLVDGNYFAPLKNHQGHLKIILDLPIRDPGPSSL
jgi:hypothetical protein